MNDEPTSSKPDSSGFHIALQRATGGPAYLGDPAVVNRLVREFIATICDRYSEVADAKLDAAQAAAADIEDAKKLGRVFTGRDEAYTAIGRWNEGGGLAQECRERFGEYIEDGVNDETAVAEAFGILVILVKHLLQDAETEEQVQVHLDALADDWSRLLLGLPMAHEWIAPEAE